ncbi:MAG: translation initiation factor eIF-2B epsilon subunit, GEF [Ramalina farinacea]|uniref:Translation initiation factor eIF2B subunit epsilon n=1 Tax=Ramalina farinacea TaxID=258253 RepID=A0AA43QEH2_9LECA|nr:translation initiation factor eIF-2B epsilon subunit, GEF [Ramalina farinacea]
MRDLDSRDVVTGDFLVVSGDVVANLNLEPALSRHRLRREADKNAIMTVVLSEVGSQSHHRGKRRWPVFVIDPTAERCLHYEEIGGKGGSRYVALDPEFLTTHVEIEVREDLVDPYIDICTPEVLAQWSENFDYQSLRKSFLHGVLKDYELNGKTVHTYILQDRYARRSGPSEVPPTNCTIQDSIIGSRCRIGSNVHIHHAHIWDDAVIEDHVDIQGPTIIAKGATVRSHVMKLPGSLVTFNAVVDNIPQKPRTGSGQLDDSSHEILNEGEDSDASSDASVGLVYASHSASTSKSSISTFASSDGDFDAAEMSRRSSFRSDPSEETAQDRDFQLEASASILDGLTKGDAADTIFLELNGYRMSVDASQHEVRQAVVLAFVKRISTLSETQSLGPVISRLFTDYKTLIDRVILDNATMEKQDQVDFLMLVQKHVIGRSQGDQILLFITKELYDQDVLEEDGVLQWWNDPKSSNGEMGQVRGLTQHFITYLQEAEEEEDSNEEQDDDESDE